MRLGSPCARGGLARLALLSSLGLGLVAGAIAPRAAQAQPAAALGKPLPASDLEVGTVSVRVVAGSASSPVVGNEVTLVVNGAPRIARTDAGGRAQFAGLPPGATVVAQVVDADSKQHTSESFTVPASGGVKVMMTTKPWQAGAGGGPFVGGPGMPSPRQMSGEGRGERGDTPGILTVRVSYDDFQDTPEGVPVVVVGYVADDSVTYKMVATDKFGRAQFTDLDRSGGTAYFAMTQLPRAGAIDRIMSTPVLLESQVGVRMMLSSDKRASTAPPIDDLGKVDPQIATPAGKVRVSLEGIAERLTVVKIVDVESRRAISEGTAEPGAPDPSRVQGGAQFVADPQVPAGALDVAIVGGPGQAEQPIPGIEVRVVAADSADASGGVAAVTGANGTVRMTVPTRGSLKAVFTINGRPLASQPFELAPSGGKLMVRANWEDTGRMQALLDVPPGAGRVVYAEATSRGQRYRSMPFQLLEAVGSKITVYVYPRTLFRFQLQAAAEDQLLGVQGRFEVMNSSWSPYRAGPDGLLIKMPEGHKGGVVFGQDQAEVSVAAGEGFRIMRPIPPGGRQFHAGFSMPVVDGKVHMVMDLPLGTYQSEIDVRKTATMTAKASPNFPIETRTVPQGTFIVMGPIGILPKQTMEVTLEGLPSVPGWRQWFPRLIGLVVVGLLVAGAAFALAGRGKPARAAATNASARRQRLLDELVELERTGDNPRRREQVLGELEQLWG